MAVFLTLNKYVIFYYVIKKLHIKNMYKIKSQSIMKNSQI